MIRFFPVLVRVPAFYAILAYATRPLALLAVALACVGF